MATTWGADAWGDNSWNTNENNISVNGISASFDLGSPTAYPNKGFGGLAWGQGQWSDLPNASAQLSGFSLTANQGQAVYTPLSGWDAYAWGTGSWGDIPNATAIPLSINLSADLGQLGQTSSTGWGRATWGSGIWNGFGTVIPDGVSASFNLGTVEIFGEINEGWGGLAWGDTGWGAAGDAFLNGIQLTSNVGSVSIANEINVGWGSDTWGYETWGTSGLVVDLTGVEASFDIGILSASGDGATGELTGQELTTTQNDVEAYINFVADITGFSLPMTLQYQEAVVNVTGNELTANDGTAVLDANTIVEISAESAVTWGNAVWGYGVFGNQPVTTLAMATNEGDVDPAPDAEVTGIAMAAFVGTLSLSGNANTGTITNINWGEQAWGDSTWGNGTYFDATGYAQAATINLGTAILDANTIADVSGQLMTMQEGDEGTSANANVSLTGNALTMASGSLKTLIWNEVNTGTAPIVPPGWQEVDTAA
jgi:hypothetical protein